MLRWKENSTLQFRKKKSLKWLLCVIFHPAWMCFSFRGLVKQNFCFWIVSQIHLRQFHGTRYAAIDPSMVSAEELEVQGSHLSSNQDSEDQWGDVHLQSNNSKQLQLVLILLLNSHHRMFQWFFSIELNSQSASRLKIFLLVRWSNIFILTCIQMVHDRCFALKHTQSFALCGMNRCTHKLPELCSCLCGREAVVSSVHC